MGNYIEKWKIPEARKINRVLKFQIKAITLLGFHLNQYLPFTCNDFP